MDLLPDEEEKSENACAACYALQKEDYDLVTLDCLPGIKLDGGCSIYGRRRGASVDDCHAVISARRSRCVLSAASTDSQAAGLRLWPQ